MSDPYCWFCHSAALNLSKCIACPRAYHPRCLTQTNKDPEDFQCPECSAILKADNDNIRSQTNLDQLSTLLEHIMDVLKAQRNARHFFGPMETEEFPHYRESIVYQMDLLSLEENVKNRRYRCTEAFLADMKWIVHNSIILNTKTATITDLAKKLLQICESEVREIESCPECYYNSLVCKDDWFIEACKTPHLLIWARFQGCPLWPAKAIGCKDDLVDCRFFGTHDKAWVPLKDVYLYSKVSPQTVKGKPSDYLDKGIQEIEKHITQLIEKFGSFVYAEYCKPYNPSAELDQLKSMLPTFNPDLPTTTETAAPISVSLISKATAVPTNAESSIEDPVRNVKKDSTETSESNLETAKLAYDESSFSATSVNEKLNEEEPASIASEIGRIKANILRVSSAGKDESGIQRKTSFLGRIRRIPPYVQKTFISLATTPYPKLTADFEKIKRESEARILTYWSSDRDKKPEDVKYEIRGLEGMLYRIPPYPQKTFIPLATTPDPKVTADLEKLTADLEKLKRESEARLLTYYSSDRDKNPEDVKSEIRRRANGIGGIHRISPYAPKTFISLATTPDPKVTADLEKLKRESEARILTYYSSDRDKNPEDVKSEIRRRRANGLGEIRRIWPYAPKTFIPLTTTPDLKVTADFEKLKIQAEAGISAFSSSDRDKKPEVKSEI